MARGRRLAPRRRNTAPRRSGCVVHHTPRGSVPGSAGRAFALRRGATLYVSATSEHGEAPAGRVHFLNGSSQRAPRGSQPVERTRLTIGCRASGGWTRGTSAFVRPGGQTQACEQPSQYHRDRRWQDVDALQLPCRRLAYAVERLAPPAPPFETGDQARSAGAARPVDRARGRAGAPAPARPSPLSPSPRPRTPRQPAAATRAAFRSTFAASPGRSNGFVT
jgi:hypothetical protein